MEASVTITVKLVFLPEDAVAVITALPFSIPVTTPFEDTAAISLLLVVHLIVSVESEGLSTALSVSFFPGFTQLISDETVTFFDGIKVFFVPSPALSLPSVVL